MLHRDVERVVHGPPGDEGSMFHIEQMGQPKIFGGHHQVLVFKDNDLDSRRVLRAAKDMVQKLPGGAIMLVKKYLLLLYCIVFMEISQVDVQQANNYGRPQPLTFKIPNPSAGDLLGSKEKKRRKRKSRGRATFGRGGGPPSPKRKKGKTVSYLRLVPRKIVIPRGVMKQLQAKLRERSTAWRNRKKRRRKNGRKRSKKGSVGRKAKLLPPMAKKLPPSVPPAAAPNFETDAGWNFQETSKVKGSIGPTFGKKVLPKGPPLKVGAPAKVAKWQPKKSFGPPPPAPKGLTQFGIGKKETVSFSSLETGKRHQESFFQGSFGEPAPKKTTAFPWKYGGGKPVGEVTPKSRTATLRPKSLYKAKNGIKAKKSKNHVVKNMGRKGGVFDEEVGPQPKKRKRKKGASGRQQHRLEEYDLPPPKDYEGPPSQNFPLAAYDEGEPEYGAPRNEQETQKFMKPLIRKEMVKNPNILWGCAASF